MILNNAQNIKYGSLQVKKVMRGATLIWEALLLDLFPNATVAYSLRKLRIEYNGFAIRVRRSSDNSEMNIGFVDNELDVTTLQTFCSGTDGFVTTWYDQSGNLNDAIQTTLLNQPQIVSSGSVILENGKPTIKNNGNNWLKTINLNIFQNTSNLSNFTVAKELTNNTSNDFYYGVTSGFFGGGDQNIFLRKNSGVFNSIFSDGIINSTTSLIRDINQNLLSSIYRGGLDVTFWKNETTNVNTTVPSIINATKELEIGSILNLSSLASELHIQELIFFKSDLTSNASNIRQNINNFYSIY